MRRILLASIAVAALGAVTASAHAADNGTQYFVGHGDKHRAKVSFRIYHGKVQDGMLCAYHVKSNRGRGNSFTLFGDAPIRSDGRFRNVRNNIPKYKFFLLSGKIHGGRANGKTRSYYHSKTSGHFQDTGKIAWDAERVSEQRWNRFRNCFPG